MKPSGSLLWYTTPAEDFDHALPIGNGRIGGMVYGTPLYDMIHLNEDSIWSGGLRNRNNPNALESLERIRSLLLEEKIDEAETLLFERMQGVSPNCRHYMPLGNLFIGLDAADAPKNYCRSLDLNTAISTVTFDIGEVTYTREMFVSAPDQVMVMHMTASRPGCICANIALDGRDDYYDDNRPISSDTLLYNGGTGSRDGIFFHTLVKLMSEGGQVTNIGNRICSVDADSITMLLAVRTNYHEGNDYEAVCVQDIAAASVYSYEELKKHHITDYQALYQRSSLSLSDNAASGSEYPTDLRLVMLRDNTLPDGSASPKEVQDNKLAELYFNFGRYLMISGSRENTLPLNLQGIWNKDMWPAWGSRYTININIQMNYWPVEICNLSECHLPLFDLIERMRPQGRITAKEMYGCRGFCAHHNTDLWGDCAPQDLWMPATIWPMGAAWLCLHIFEHYLFTGDKAFLASKYETLKEAALFFVDYLMEDKQGRLVTGPSVSPENTYQTASGTKGSLCIGPSMDSQIITVLFRNVLDSARILEKTKEDESFLAELETILTRLPQPEIGKYGQIKEWAEDYDEVEPGHRHVSQLFALYPADLISPDKTPVLSRAARATLERRLAHGGGHTGWSRAWMINFWARLQDTAQVQDNIRKLLCYSTNMNMLDSHPPFQIDGNFGATAGIAEALLQSHSGVIRFLPALPPAWSEGQAKGFMARGAFSTDFSWTDGQLTEASILSKQGGTCCIYLPTGSTTIRSDGRDIAFTLENGIASFETEAGKIYTLSMNA